MFWRQRGIFLRRVAEVLSLRCGLDSRMVQNRLLHLRALLTQRLIPIKEMFGIGVDGDLVHLDR